MILFTTNLQPLSSTDHSAMETGNFRQVTYQNEIGKSRFLTIASLTCQDGKFKQLYLIITTPIARKNCQNFNLEVVILAGKHNIMEKVDCQIL